MVSMVSCFELFSRVEIKYQLSDSECENHLGHEIQTDHVTELRRLDITVIDNDNKTALLIDIAVPGEATLN